MKKQLVQVDNLDDFICRAESRIFVDDSVILTPGAKDELAKRGVAVIYGPCPSSSSCGLHAAAPSKMDCLGGSADLEGLLLGVAAMLQKECGITDPAALKAASLKAIQTIRENL